MLGSSDGINNHLVLHGETKEEKWQSPGHKAGALPHHNLTNNLRVIFILGSLPHPFLEQQGISYSHVILSSFAIQLRSQLLLICRTQWPLEGVFC